MLTWISQIFSDMVELEHVIKTSFESFLLNYLVKAGHQSEKIGCDFSPFFVQ